MSAASSEVFRVGFLGAGKMATALARGWMGAGLLSADRMIASDPLPPARDAFHKHTGAAATDDNRAVVQKSELVVLAVKPQHMAEVCAGIRPSLTANHLVM